MCTPSLAGVWKLEFSSYIVRALSLSLEIHSTLYTQIPIAAATAAAATTTLSKQAGADRLADLAAATAVISDSLASRELKYISKSNL